MRGFVQLFAGAVCDRAYFVCLKKKRAVLMPLLCLALFLASPHSWAQEKAPQEKPAPTIVPPPPNVKFTTRLDRTAVWIGDQFHYLIIVEYPTD